MSALPNIVLVHGAWADGSCWSDEIQRLQSEGYKVSAPQLPETSLADDVAKVLACSPARAARQYSRHTRTGAR